MALTVVHAKVNTIADDPAASAAGEVLPSDWNANHTIAGTASDAQLADVITAGGPTGSATAVPVITYDAKGRLTAITTASITQPSAANPTGSVGPTAINGSAATFMRSDGAPALDVTITPTWTGAHIFRAGSGIPITASPVAIDSTITSITGTAPAVIAATLPASNDLLGMIGYGANALPVVFDFFKTRSATTTAPSTVGNADGLFRIYAWGAGGSAYRQSGYFGIDVDGTASATSMPGVWKWATSAVGSVAPTVRLSLDSSGFFSVTNTGAIGFSSGVASATALDTILTRAAAATWNLGAAAADTTGVSQTLQAQGVTTGGTNNQAGGNLTIASGQGKGNVASSLIFQTPAVGASGNTLQTLTTALTINSSQNATFAANNITLGNIIAGATSGSAGTRLDIKAPGTIAGTLENVAALWKSTTAGSGLLLRVKDGEANLAGTWIVGGVNMDLSLSSISSGGTYKEGFRVLNTTGLLQFAQYTTAGLLQNDASGNVTTLTGNLTLPGSLLQFVGTTSSFPAIKRNATVLEAKLADDSAYTQVYGATLRTGQTTVANLPAASTAGAGATAFVTDANATFILGLGLTAVGGGSNKVPVYSDGTNWIVG